MKESLKFRQLGIIDCQSPPRILSAAAAVDVEDKAPVTSKLLTHQCLIVLKIKLKTIWNFTLLYLAGSLLLPSVSSLRDASPVCLIKRFWDTRGIAELLNLSQNCVLGVWGIASQRGIELKERSTQTAAKAFGREAEDGGRRVGERNQAKLHSGAETRPDVDQGSVTRWPLRSYVLNRKPPLTQC